MVKPQNSNFFKEVFMKKALVLLLIVALLPLSFVGKTKAIQINNITASPSTAGATAYYTFGFQMTNPVPASTGSISIIFPSGFTVPQGPINPSYITVNAGGNIALASATGSSLTLTIVPSAQIPLGYVYVYISNQANFKNPSIGGTYTFTISTSTPGEPAGHADLLIQSAVQNVSVTVTPLNAGGYSNYTIWFNPGVALSQNIDSIYIDFPTGTTLPTSIQANLITVNGAQCSYVTQTGGTRLQIRTPLYIPQGANTYINIPQTFGIINPPTAGTYTIKVSTSQETTQVDSNTFTLVGSNITNLYVYPTPPSAGVAATYTVQFTTGPAGGLTTTNDYVTITFPQGTTIPTNTSASYININGYTCTNRYVNGNALTIYIPLNAIINANSLCIITISSSFGIVNPITPGNYTLQVSTSKDTIPGTSNTYSITGTSVSNFTVSADPATQNSNAEYTLNFRTSSTGALYRSSSDKIYIQFPTEFTVPTSIAGSYVTVNGTSCTTNISVSSDKLTITTPVDIGNNTNVEVVIAQAANIRNPSSSGTYSFSLSTTKDVVPKTANLQIVKSTITKPQVQLTGYAVNEVVGVTVTFSTGTGGALTANSDKISITFPTGFVLPSTVSNQYVKVNNYNVITVSKSGQRIDITPSISIPANSNVTVVIDKAANIKNPATQGTNYIFSVYTTKENTAINSDPISIVILPKTTIAVIPANPDGLNGYYKTAPRVTLTATSPVDNNPAIYYFFDTGTPVVYSGPFTVPDGIHTLSFYAIDRLQNREGTQTRQFKVDTAPPAISITSPQNNAILNSRTFDIVGRTEAGASLTVNGNPVNVLPDGSFTYPATISGPATFTFIATDSAGNSAQSVLTVSLDTTPPLLEVTEPKAFEKIHTQFVTVRGRTEKDAKVTVNGTAVSVNPDLTFSYSLTLTVPGLNSIEVIAQDLAGNETKVSIPVEFVPKTTIVLQVGNANAIINDKTVRLDAPPQIVKDRTFVPLRMIAEAFGADVKWDPVFRLVFITLGDKSIVLQIGTSYASNNGVKYTLEAEPFIQKGYTMVPIRFIAEALNSDVNWEPNTKTVTIVYPK